MRRRSAERLRSAGISSGAWEADQLLLALVGGGVAGLVARDDQIVSPELAARFESLIERRAAREPLQHLIGRWPFLELELKVDRRGLIPRPETEDLVLAARTLLPTDRPSLAIDVGTGSGCIAIGLAFSHPQARVIAVEKSPEAHSLAAENLVATETGRRVELRFGSLLEPLLPHELADLIVANLPYVAPEEWQSLEPEVRDHDPRSALVAEQEGLALNLELIAAAPPRLVSGGYLLIEHAPRQAERLTRAMIEAGFAVAESELDRFGRIRMSLAKRG